MKSFYRFLQRLGFDPLITYGFFRNILWYVKSYYKFKRTKSSKDFKFKINFLPILHERFSTSGALNGHYFHQDLYVAQKIFKNNPKNHLDIGSSIYGFVSNVASFRKIEIVDIRENHSSHENIIFRKLDLTKKNMIEEKKYDSISCLHVIEHFGLGRYNDQIDYNGYIKGLLNIAKLQSKNDCFYLGTPVGKSAIHFNAHRIFDPFHILDILKNDYSLQEFSFVDDNGDFHVNIKLESLDFNKIKYGCGIFILKKIV